jgi:lysophospholipase L1-like esterase
VGLFPFSAGVLPDQQPAQATGLTGASGTTLLQAAIANRNNAPCNIVVIGDSITEGVGASSFANRWVTQANRAVRDTYPASVNGTAGGLGFIPIETTGIAPFTWPITAATGTNPADFTEGDLGPVRQGLFLYGTCTFTFTAPAGTTSVKVMYNDQSGAGTFSYKVGAGAATNVSNAGTNLDILTADIPLTSGQVLTIAWVSGSVYVDGIIHYAGDETSGITFHGCGHQGWDASAGAQGWNKPEQFSLNWIQCFNALAPSAIMVMLGTNDQSRVTAPVFQANLAAFIAALQAQNGLISLPLIPVITYAPAGATDDPGGWPAYAAAMRSDAAPLNASHVIDLNYRMPSVSSGFDGGALYSIPNPGHPTNLGHALIGEIVAAAVRIS